MNGRNRSFLTLCVTSPPSITALRKDYSITSSARPSSVSGTVRPSALAVLRLTKSISISHPIGHAQSLRCHNQATTLMLAHKAVAATSAIKAECSIST